MPAIKNQMATVINHCGWLEKKGSTIKSWRKRWFILTGLEIQYFDREGKTLKGSMKLDKTMRIALLSPQSNYSSKSFRFCVATSDRLLELSARSVRERSGWIVALRKFGKSSLGAFVTTVNEEVDFQHFRKWEEAVLNPTTDTSALLPPDKYSQRGISLDIPESTTVTVSPVVFADIDRWQEEFDPDAYYQKQQKQQRRDERQRQKELQKEGKTAPSYADSMKSWLLEKVLTGVVDGGSASISRHIIEGICLLLQHAERILAEDFSAALVITGAATATETKTVDIEVLLSEARRRLVPVLGALRALLLTFRFAAVEGKEAQQTLSPVEQAQAKPKQAQQQQPNNPGVLKEKQEQKSPLERQLTFTRNLAVNRLVSSLTAVLYALDAVARARCTQVYQEASGGVATRLSRGVEVLGKCVGDRDSTVYNDKVSGGDLDANMLTAAKRSLQIAATGGTVAQSKEALGEDPGAYIDKEWGSGELPQQQHVNTPGGDYAAAAVEDQEVYEVAVKREVRAMLRLLLGQAVQSAKARAVSHPLLEQLRAAAGSASAHVEHGIATTTAASTTTTAATTTAATTGELAAFGSCEDSGNCANGGGGDAMRNRAPGQVGAEDEAGVSTGEEVGLADEMRNLFSQILQQFVETKLLVLEGALVDYVVQFCDIITTLQQHCYPRSDGNSSPNTSSNSHNNNTSGDSSRSPRGCDSRSKTPEVASMASHIDIAASSIEQRLASLSERMEALGVSGTIARDLVEQLVTSIQSPDVGAAYNTEDVAERCVLRHAEGAWEQLQQGLRTGLDSGLRMLLTIAGHPPQSLSPLP